MVGVVKESKIVPNRLVWIVLLRGPQEKPQCVQYKVSDLLICINTSREMMTLDYPQTVILLTQRCLNSCTLVLRPYDIKVPGKTLTAELCLNPISTASCRSLNFSKF